MAGQLVGPHGIAGQVDVATVTVADDIDAGHVATAIEVIGNLLETILAVFQHHHLDPCGKAGNQLLVVTDGRVDEHHFVAARSRGGRRRGGDGVVRSCSVLRAAGIAGHAGVLGRCGCHGLGALVGDHGYRGVKHHARFQRLDEARTVHGNGGLCVRTVAFPESHVDLIQPCSWLFLSLCPCSGVRVIAPQASQGSKQPRDAAPPWFSCGSGRCLPGQ